MNKVTAGRILKAVTDLKLCPQCAFPLKKRVCPCCKKDWNEDLKEAKEALK